MRLPGRVLVQADGVGTGGAVVRAEATSHPDLRLLEAYARGARPAVGNSAGRMKITLRYFTGCPNWRTTDRRLRTALDEAGLAAEIALETVETPDDAARLGFRGSPTVLIEGRDPFADVEAPVGLACRIYLTESGPQGAPSVAQLRAAIHG